MRLAGQAAARAPLDRPTLAAGALLGIGLGGFVHGIAFHQILQLHSMLSNWIPRDTVARLEVNMVWDGLFHASCWVAVAVALGLLWRALRARQGLPPGLGMLGALVLGWGIFNLVEGLVDHQLLRLHHVYQAGPHLPWDLAFLASGLVLAAAGSWLVRAGDRAVAAARG